MQRLARNHPARSPIVWCLLLALAVYGVQATIVRLLGSMHRHVEVVAALEDCRRIVPGAGSAREHHEHHGFERHHHGADDAGVVALDGAASQGDEGAPSGFAALTLALAPAVELESPAALTFAWPLAPAAEVGNRVSGPPEYPPKA